MTGLVYDPRYTIYSDTLDSTSFNLIEWDVMEENGVGQKLWKKSNYVRNIGGNPASLKTKQLTFSTRTTIPWSLKCEIEEGKDR